VNLLSIPLRCLRRKWLKNLLLVLVFTLGVAAITALAAVSRVVGESLEKKLTAFGANILIQPRTDRLTVSYGGLSLGDMLYGLEYLDADHVDRAVDGIALRQNVSVVAPKLVVPAKSGNLALAVVGVRFEREKLLKGYWAVTGALPANDGQVLLGSAAADRLAATPGGSVTISGRSLAVSGVLAPTGGEDDNVAFAPLSLAQSLAGLPGKANLVEVAALCAGCPIEDIVAQLGAALPGVEIKALRQVVEQRMTSVHFVKNLALAVSLVILLTACAMVAASMLSAVNERVREIGLLRSLGFSRGAVFTLFSAEALVLGLVSGLAGHLAGFAAGGPILAALHAEGAAPAFDPQALALTALAAALVCVLSTLFPAWKASRIEPSQALIAL
jgi:putative ABC transport system permease protein